MSQKSPVQTVFVQVVERPARKLICKPARTATHYFEYCEEVGCEVWETLCGVPGALGEPMGLWMPAELRAEGESEYQQGVEVATDYSGPVPDGLVLRELPPCRQMIFQGPPFEDEQFEEAIGQLWEVIKNYDPSLVGYAWADQDGPRFQLEPRGYRGYIEGRPVRPRAQG